MTRSQAALALFLVAACGDGGGGPGAGDAAPADAPQLSGDYAPLITADWSLSTGQERYLCATKTLTQDLYIGAIRPVAPQGTHHTVVSLIDPQGPDDPGSPCGPMFGEFYASGVGTEELILPAGVGLVAPAGMQVMVNLHLFNATDGPISGTSGVEVKLVDPSQLQHPASLTFYGPFTFDIPPTGLPHEYEDTTTLAAGQTLIAIFPHMHQIGTHFKAEIDRGGTITTLWDDDFQFETQEFALIEPFTTQSGDVLRTTCTWVNTTGSSISWGDSSTAEMCFAIVMAY